MKKISYDWEAPNTARVLGYGYMAGKPAATLKPGDVMYTFIGERMKIRDVVVRDDETIITDIHGTVHRRESTATVPVLFNSYADAARNGHKVPRAARNRRARLMSIFNLGVL